MPGKSPANNEESSASLLKFREKRKWQINLRRYVLQKSLCPYYAPYFGLDINHLRRWFEYQFTEGLSWESFGQNWQFDHVIPVTYFDFSLDEELKTCWHFTNLRVGTIQKDKEGGNRLDILAARHYFRDLYTATQYEPCKKLLDKIDRIEMAAQLSNMAQQQFIKENQAYLNQIARYSAFEYELLNSGRNVEEVNKEIAFLANLGKPAG